MMHTTNDPEIDLKVEELLVQMTLEEKISLMSGKDNWATVPIPRLGIPSIVMTDGPHGVRTDGPGQNRPEGPATAYPTGVSMAASWDPDLVYQVGQGLAEETRFLGCNILLGPCVNIMRVPLAGRNFESYSEDPYLAGQVGLAYVSGLQSLGIGASLKHFACNNQEFERNRGNSVVDERTLREIYLPAFETIVKGAQPWTVMCSYNRINGTYASENQKLLTRILRDEWEFKGLVVSDWNAVHDTTAPVQAGLDLEMPGPAKWFGNLLKEAVDTWQVDVSKIDQAVRRILRIILISGQMEKSLHPNAKSGDTPEHRALARELAHSSITLLKNDHHLLPLNKKKTKKLAVIGLNATHHITGGGSSYVKGHHWVTPLEGLTEYLGKDIEILYEPGFDNRGTPENVPANCLLSTDGISQGLRASIYNNPNFEGKPNLECNYPALDLWWGHAGPDRRVIDPKAFSGVWEGKYKPLASGPTPLFLVHTGHVKLFVNNALQIEHFIGSFDLSTGNFEDIVCQVVIDMDKEKLYDIRIEYSTQSSDGFAFLQFNHIPAQVPHDALERALAIARSCDSVLVFAGNPLHFESEGVDRPEMGLPGDQDELISAVAKVNPNTVVVLNAGSPVLMPWINEVRSVVLAYYPGQEGGHAIADILFGNVNPSGKLTFTIPGKYEDNPSFLNYPGSRDVLYGEGIFVGYRYYDTKDVSPLFCFGHGLSYTNFEYSELVAPESIKQGEVLEISFKVKNTGDTPGKEVAQVYINDQRSRLQRPIKELKAFSKVYLEAGEEKIVTLKLNERAFSYFDPDRKSWVAEPGVFNILVGSSSRDIRVKRSFTLVD